MGHIRRLFWHLLVSVSGYSRLFRDVVYPKEERDIILSRQSQKLYDLIHFANISVSFYRGTFDQLLDGGVTGAEERFQSEVPIIDKMTFKRADKELLSESYKERFDSFSFKLDGSLFRSIKKLLFQRDFIFSISTGGTTGSPLISYKNKQSLLTDGLLFFRGWRMMGWNPGDKVLWFYHSYYDNRFSFMNMIAPLTGIRLFFFDSLTDEVIEDFVSVVNSFRPKIIVTFPSYINDAATTIRRNNLELHHFPEGVEVSGESFFPHQRKNIDEIFQTKSYDGYGTIEFGMVAHECRFRKGMHVYEDIVSLESVDHEADPNSIVATRYDSRDVPIIRYKVGDRGVLKRRECRCGRFGLLLESVDGRVDDYVEFSDGQRMYPSAFRQILSSCNQRYGNAVVESNLIQLGVNELKFQVVLSNKGLQNDIEGYLLAEIQKHLPAHVTFRVLFVDTIRGRRKFRFIEKSAGENKK